MLVNQSSCWRCNGYLYRNVLMHVSVLTFNYFLWLCYCYCLLKTVLFELSCCLLYTYVLVKSLNGHVLGCTYITVFNHGYCLLYATCWSTGDVISVTRFNQWLVQSQFVQWLNVDSSVVKISRWSNIYPTVAKFCHRWIYVGQDKMTFGPTQFPILHRTFHRHIVLKNEQYLF